VPGLQIFDWVAEAWLDVEGGCPAGHAVVFGGESLARLTNQFVLPAVHQVVPLAGRRLSVPFQLMPSPGGRFDYSLLDSSTVGPCVDEYRGSMCVGSEEFLSEISQGKLSCY
jgi:hypothetical protein